MHMLAVKCMQVDMSIAFGPWKCILTKYSILTAVASCPRSVLSAPFHPLITSLMSAVCICVRSWSYLSLLKHSPHRDWPYWVVLLSHRLLTSFAFASHCFFSRHYMENKTFGLLGQSFFSKCSENSIYFQPKSAEIISAVQWEQK